ncbi:hypothetical protein LIPSTDRAFT_3258 [Lipomyces starkeyi NRRL Y-11557]|uniref:BZIP domain-containing protein n=1 Tax=Lipomyces starkeyi NRRL Y-11557 TaxID=675824 RepID=A0A1E3Q5P5_LIPST|nr:hypothetical protein LIPSTDRAFT_3258 [Lipomyces starkeyi NRRL Y-11557]
MTEKSNQFLISDAMTRKLKRGRPRFYTQHLQTDRRRAQIHEAQRNYRLKKERTIAELNEQIIALQSAVETIKCAFLDIYDEGRRIAIRHHDVNFVEALDSATVHVLAIVKDEVALPSEGTNCDAVNLTKPLRESLQPPLSAAPLSPVPSAKASAPRFEVYPPRETYLSSSSTASAYLQSTI